MRRTSVVAVFALAGAMGLFGGVDEDKRLEAAAITVQEMAGAGDEGIPRNLFEKAVCAVVVPGMKKGGFIVGAKYGRGFASCRQGGHWSAPSGVRVEGGNFGLLIGGAESDIILLVMNEKGMQRLLGSKFVLGGEAAAAAGPVGRDSSAMTDATMRAEILSWSRSRGVFGGISLQGSTLRPDDDANHGLYGGNPDPKAILGGKLPTPASSKQLLAELSKFGGTAKKK